MDFSKTDTRVLLTTWNNLKSGLDKVDAATKNGTFNTVGPKGEAPPSQSGWTTQWFAKAVHAELHKRGILGPFNWDRAG